MKSKVVGSTNKGSSESDFVTLPTQRLRKGVKLAFVR